MILKKAILIGIFFQFLFSVAYANNFYAGIGGGRQAVNFNKTLTIDDQATGENLFYKNDNQPGRGFFGNLFAGYEGEYRNFSLAGEINVGASTLTYHGVFVDRENDEKSEAEYTMPRSYGLSLIPGYKVGNCNWLIYGRVGGIRGDFKYWEYKTTPSTGDIRGVTQWAWLNALRYGVGIEGLITKNIGLRLEYDHLQFQSFTNNYFPGFSGKNRVIQFSPSMDEMEMDLVYKFG